MTSFNTTDSSSNGPRPTARAYEAYRGPPSQSNMSARRFSSIPLMILLYSASVPFTPTSWFFAANGSFLVDQLCAGIIILCACYFQWQIAGLDHALVISLPGSSSQSIRNGRVERGGDMSFIWQTSNYWPYAACEAVALALAEFGPSEMLRRAIVIGVLAALWLIGFPATPRSTRRWAWEHIKNLWFWMVLNELLNVGRGVPNRRQRRY